MNRRTKVLHLIGSPESQFFADLSLLYASGCLESACDLGRYQSTIAYVGPDGLWRFPKSLGIDDVTDAKGRSLAEAIHLLEKLELDVIIPQMFCYSGMTHFRSVPDLLDVPMVGNPASVMAVAADKVLTRSVVSAAGVRVPDATVLRRSLAEKQTNGLFASETQLKSLSARLPLVVKPAISDNSVGVSRATCEEELREAVNEAFEHCDTVLIEQYIPLGREVRCGLIERQSELVCLPLQEYRMEGENSFIRATSSKLTRTEEGNLDLTSKHVCQSWIVDISDPLTQQLWSIAKHCHQSLGCSDYSLFDFRIDANGRPWFLEAGLYCSFSPSSIVVAMAEAAGVTLNTLFDDLVEQALQRKRRSTKGGVATISPDAVENFTVRETAIDHQ